MHYREHGEDPPPYVSAADEFNMIVMFPGEDTCMFTVEVVYNGFFCGLRGHLQYVSATTAHFDNCTTDTWSLSWVDNILGILGHTRGGRVSVYWCLPDKDLNDGLVLIENPTGIRQMINAAKTVKTLVMFVDHTNFLKGLRDDAFVRPAGPAVPFTTAAGTHAPTAGPFVSSIAVAATHAPTAGPSTAAASRHAPTSGPSTALAATHGPCTNGGSSSSSVIMKKKELPDGSGDDGVEVAADSDSSSNDDSDFIDSDYNAESGDDDLFADNIDKSVNDHNEKEICDEKEDEEALEDNDLNIGEGDREKLSKAIKPFNPEVDMDNPCFRLGMKFTGVEELRKALTTYGIRNRKHIKKTKNDRRRLEAHCAPGYTWFLKSSNDAKRTGGFVITSYEGNHTCEGSWPIKAITTRVLTEKFMHEFRDNQKLGLHSFSAKVVREFKMSPPRWKLSRARKAALEHIYGDEVQQFNQLFDYGQELRRSNPGSQFFITANSVNDLDSPDHKEHLATVYWSYDACKRGFLSGCRPFICLDGCHIKTKYKGVLLTAVGIDPNDCIYPIAFGLAEVECTSSWEWFLTNLKDDLNITNTAPWTIMSDRQKGLINAVEKIFPDAEHRFCVRHLIQNFQRAGHRGETLKNDIWEIARSTFIPKWQRTMDKLKVDSTSAFTWIEQLVPNTWIKAFFSEFPKCDMLLNNHSEVFNSYIVDAREMPFLSMLETIFNKILQRIESKQREGLKMTGRICPKIKKKLDKFIEWSNECGVTPAGNYKYFVSSFEFDKDYSVDFRARTCDCRRWQLTGIPCHHVVACCRKDNINPENLVHTCYTVDTYNKAYGFNLAPLRGRTFWEKCNGPTIHPPLFTKVMGRPKKNRRKAPEEKIKKGKKIFTKAGVTIHCSICGKADHNKKGHQKYLDNLAEQRQNNIFQEDEEIDIPSILEHCIPHTPNPTMDPSNQQESMVFMMQAEEQEHVPIERLLGPLPENAFVVAARESIPAARGRVTTASARGKLRGKGSRGRSNAPRAEPRGTLEQGRSSTRGRGKGKKRPASESSIPDLNVEVPDVNIEEFHYSQNAPAFD